MDEILSANTNEQHSLRWWHRLERNHITLCSSDFIFNSHIMYNLKKSNQNGKKHVIFSMTF